MNEQTDNATQRDDYPWLKTYPDHLSWHREIPQRPLHEYLDEAVEAWGSNLCVDFLDRTYTYAEIGALVNKAAKGFQSIGVGKGTRVGLCLPNTPYSVICYFGILKAGGVVVNYNPLYVEREIANQITDSGTDIMVTMDLQALYPKVGAMLAQTGLKKIVVCRMRDILPPVKGVLFSLLKSKDVARIPDDSHHVPFNRLIDNDGRFDPVDVGIDDVAVLQYTGGTTGIPKGAMLTHGNLSANVEQLADWNPDWVDGEERILGVLPLFHVFAMTVVMNMAIGGGAAMILLPRFDLEQCLKTIHKKRPTLFPAVPTIYTAINHAPNLSKYDLSSLKFCNSGGAPLPLEVRKTFQELTGCNLVEGYGLSETSPVATSNPVHASKEGSIGIPLPGTIIEIHSLEDRDKVVPQGEKGEVCIRGKQVMAGYWNKPEETENTLVDGCLHTGDVGYMDEDGYTFLVDRLKDVILAGGYNVYPRVIEEAIYQHPAVSEVTVIGVDDEYRGQSPKAFVKLREGRELTDAELLEFLKDKLSKIEMPRFIEFRDELPKTIIGKLSKKELVAEEKARREAAKTDRG